MLCGPKENLRSQEQKEQKFMVANTDFINVIVFYFIRGIENINESSGDFHLPLALESVNPSRVPKSHISVFC